MVRVTGAAEAGLWGLVRGAIAAGGPLRRIAEAFHDAVRPPKREETPVPQLALWVTDAEGLPARPWRVYRDDIVPCAAMGCPVPAHVCVARQHASELQRTRDSWRGQCPEYPSCVTERCAQGRGVRNALDPNASVAWKGTGPLGRVPGTMPHRKRRAQEAARDRLEREGMLDPVRTLDVDADPTDEESAR